MLYICFVKWLIDKVIIPCFVIGRYILTITKYCQISNIRSTKSQNLNVSHLVFAIVFTQSIEARHQVVNEDVVGAGPTGDALTTSKWSIILLPTKVAFILEVWWYIKLQSSKLCLFIVYMKHGFKDNKEVYQK